MNSVNWSNTIVNKHYVISNRATVPLTTGKPEKFGFWWVVLELIGLPPIRINTFTKYAYTHIVLMIVRKDE